MLVRIGSRFINLANATWIEFRSGGLRYSLSAVIRKGRQVARRIEGGEVIVTNRLGSLLAVFKADTGFVLTVIRIEDRGISRR